MENRNLEQDIIKVARDVFIHNGYTETSMTDIAEKTGINRPTLHYYFRTKDKLFDAVFGDIIKESMELIRYMLHSDLPFIERLETIIDSYFAHFKNNPDLPMFFLKEIQREPIGFLNEINQPGIRNLLVEVMTLYEKEIRESKIKEVPFDIALPSFYMLLITPFIGERLMETPVFNDTFNMENYLKRWKEYMLKHYSLMLGI